MAISKALSAFAGIARAGKAIVEKEQEETADITKLGLKQTLANIATAKKNHTEGMQEFREKMEGVRALQRWQYKDPATGNSVPVTRGQAIALIQATGGTKEALQALQDAEIAFKGEGEVGPIQYTTAGALDQETVEAFTEEDDTVGVAPLSLAKGRGARAMANVQKVVDKLGLPKDGYKTPVGLPEVSGVKIISTKNTSGEDVDSLSQGMITTTINGKEESAFAFVGDDRIVYVVEGDKAVPVGESDKWRGGSYAPTIQKTMQETPMGEKVDTYEDRYFRDNKTYQTMADEYRKKQAGIKVLSEAYNQMGPLATDETVYSGVAKLAGRVAKRAQIEFAGIAFTIAAGVDKDYIASEKIKEFDNFIEENKNITDPIVKAQVLEAIAGRAAVAYLKATGEDRFSDQDMRRGLAQFVANDPETFLQLARSNWASQTSEARDMRQSLLDYNGFSFYENTDRYSEAESKAIESVVKQYVPEEFAPEVPYFLADGYEVEIRKEMPTDTASEEITIDVNIKGTTVQATYDPETDEIVIGNLSMSSTEAMDAKYITKQQLKALRD